MLQIQWEMKGMMSQTLRIPWERRNKMPHMPQIPCEMKGRMFQELQIPWDMRRMMSQVATNALGNVQEY